MIKIKSIYNDDLDKTSIKQYKFKKTHTMEHLGLILFLIKQMKLNQKKLGNELTTKDIFQYIEAMEEINE